MTRSSKKISEPQAHEQALQRALKAIRLGDQSEAEIRHKLRGYSAEVGDTVILLLKRDRLVNDQRLVENAVLNWKALPPSKTFANRRLYEKLLARGIQERYLSPILDLPNPPLKTVLATRFDPASPSDSARASRWLSSKGFEEDDIQSAIETFFGF